MSLAAGQYEGRVGGRIYNTSSSLGATMEPIYHHPVHAEMTPQRREQIRRKAQRIQAAQGRPPAGGDQQFWHQTQQLQRQSDMVLLGRTKTQALLSSSAARRSATYEHKMYELQTFARHPVTVHEIPQGTPQTVALTGLGACVVGACLGALFL